MSTRVTRRLLLALGTFATSLVAIGPLALRAADDAPAPADAGAAADDEAPEPQDNPYLAPAGLPPADLVRWLERMLAKPDTIRARPGFVEAILDATERILAAPEATQDQRDTATLARLASLHHVACLGDEKADAQLFELAAEVKDSANADVAAAAGFHLLEQRAQQADKLSQADLPALLDELNAFFAAESPTTRHLRLASLSVRAVNMLDDTKARAPYFEALGNRFATSDDRKLRSYGKQVAKAALPQPSDLVGETLEIEGTTLEGTTFDWAGYRGKVVLVDFWATWCGPCRAELPNVLANYQKYHDRGFEVVGISLDQDREALETFLREQQIPWVTLWDPDGEDANAEKYAVRAIPFPVLVDREGKVVSVEARGPKLGALLEELLK